MNRGWSKSAGSAVVSQSVSQSVGRFVTAPSELSPEEPTFSCRISDHVKSAFVPIIADDGSIIFELGSAQTREPGTMLLVASVPARALAAPADSWPGKSASTISRPCPVHENLDADCAHADRPLRCAAPRSRPSAGP
jgi:hypothetical protein